MKTRFALVGFLVTVVILFATEVQGIHRVSAATTPVETGSLQDQINAQTDQIAKISAKITQYQADLLKVGADKKTLQSAIASLDLERKKVESQVALVQHQINTTQLQIQQLGTGIAKTQTTIRANEAALGAGMRSVQMSDEKPMVVQIVSAHSLSEIWNDVDASAQILKAIQEKVDALKVQKLALASSKNASQEKENLLSSQKKTLSTQQQSLVANKQSKTQLLTQTKAQEANYQKLLAAAKAELASFTAFTTNAGGSKLLANQTSCDDWGCYYSQRDTLWGNVPLSGTNERLAASGCLVTSMAMMMTHYGYHDVTPVSINAVRGNFSPFGGLLLFTINVGGATATRYKVATIDATLASGNPVVVGVHAYGGTHYVVLTSGSNGSYLMRDPYVANGKDISFTSHYTVGSIFGISKVITS